MVQDEVNELYATASTLERAIYTLFRIDLTGLITNKAHLCKDPFSLQPSEIDKMAFWEYELFLQIINKRLSEENKKSEEEQKKYGDMNPKSMMNNFHSSMPRVIAPKLG